jgi:hypothetical protein
MLDGCAGTISFAEGSYKTNYEMTITGTTPSDGNVNYGANTPYYCDYIPLYVKFVYTDGLKEYNETRMIRAQYFAGETEIFPLVYYTSFGSKNTCVMASKLLRSTCNSGTGYLSSSGSFYSDSEEFSSYYDKSNTRDFAKTLSCSLRASELEVDSSGNRLIKLRVTKYASSGSGRSQYITVSYSDNPGDAIGPVLSFVGDSTATVSSSVDNGTYQEFILKYTGDLSTNYEKYFMITVQVFDGNDNYSHATFDVIFYADVAYEDTQKKCLSDICKVFPQEYNFQSGYDSFIEKFCKYSSNLLEPYADYSESQNYKEDTLLKDTLGDLVPYTLSDIYPANIKVLLQGLFEQTTINKNKIPTWEILE